MSKPDPTAVRFDMPIVLTDAPALELATTIRSASDEQIETVLGRDVIYKRGKIVKDCQVGSVIAEIDLPANWKEFIGIPPAKC